MKKWLVFAVCLALVSAVVVIAAEEIAKDESKTIDKAKVSVWVGYRTGLNLNRENPVSEKDMKELLRGVKAGMEGENAVFNTGWGIGANIARQLEAGDIDMDALARGLQLAIAGENPPLTGKEADLLMADLRKELGDRNAAKAKADAVKNKEAGEAFLEANKGREGVVTLPSGLQYEVLVKGEGDSPKDGDKAQVEYRGTLINGKEFDGNYMTEKPAEFGVNQVIKGWTEALKLMQPGAVWKLYIPSDLAYGEKGGGGIGPNETLIFKVKLIKVLSGAALKAQPGPDGTISLSPDQIPGIQMKVTPPPGKGEVKPPASSKEDAKTETTPEGIKVEVTPPPAKDAPKE